MEDFVWYSINEKKMRNIENKMDQTQLLFKFLCAKYKMNVKYFVILGGSNVYQAISFMYWKLYMFSGNKILNY